MNDSNTSLVIQSEFLKRDLAQANAVSLIYMAATIFLGIGAVSMAKNNDKKEEEIKLLLKSNDTLKNEIEHLRKELAAKA